MTSTTVSTSWSRRVALFTASLAVVCCIALEYAAVGAFEFVSYDDNTYVSQNAMVQQGLSFASFKWAATSFHGANWHPVTWLSHMLDWELFGPWAGGHHLMNVALHAMAAVLLLILLESLTRAFWPSAAVAALFAVHPMNVESVAWVSERKNVLSTLILFLLLLAWREWVRGGRRRWYAITFVLSVLGVMTKPMLITVPALLLIVDFWPLRRCEAGTAGSRVARRDLVLEKIPFVVAAVPSGLVTILAQRAGRAMEVSTDIAWTERVLNAPAAWGWYLVTAAWPSGLSVFYKHPATIGESVSRIGAAAGMVALVAAGVVAVRLRTGRPWLLFGYEWYCVSLMPVIGIIQVGAQAHADRYAYVPLLGVFIALAWELAALVHERQGWRYFVAPLGAVFLISFVMLGTARAGVWRNSRTLFEAAVRQDPENWVALNSLGALEFQAGRTAEATALFRRSIAHRPNAPETVYNLAFARATVGEWEEAIPLYVRASELAPHVSVIPENLCLAYLNTGDLDLAATACSKALVIDARSPHALHGLALIAARQGRMRAVDDYYRRLRDIDAAEADRLRGALAWGRAAP